MDKMSGDKKNKRNKKKPIRVLQISLGGGGYRFSY